MTIENISNQEVGNSDLPKISDFHTHLITVSRQSTNETSTITRPETGLISRSLGDRTTETAKAKIGNTTGNVQQQSLWQKICEWFTAKFGNSQDKAAIELTNAIKNNKIGLVESLLANPENSSLKQQIKNGIVEDRELFPKLIQFNDENVKRLLQALDLGDLQEQYRQFLGNGLLEVLTGTGKIKAESVESERVKLEESGRKKNELTRALEGHTQEKAKVDEEMPKCDEKCSQLTKSVESLEREKANLSKEIIDLENEIKPIKEKIEKIETDMEPRIKEERKKQKAAELEIHGQGENREGGQPHQNNALKEGLRSKFQALMGCEWSEAGDTVTSLEKTAREKQVELDKAEEELKTANSTLILLDETINTTKERLTSIEKITKQITDANEKIKNLTAKGAQKNAEEISRLTEQVMRLEEALEKLVEKKLEWRKDINETITNLEEKTCFQLKIDQDAYEEISTKIANLSDNVRALQIEVTKYTNAVKLVKGYSEAKAELDNKFAAIQKQGNNALENIRTLQGEMSTQQEEIRSKYNLKEKEKSLTEKKTKLGTLETEITSKRSESGGAETELNTLKAKQSNLERQIASEGSELEKTEKEYETFSKTYSEKLGAAKQAIERAKTLSERIASDDKIQELKQALQSPTATKKFVEELLKSSGIGSVVRAIYEKLSPEEQKVFAKAIFSHLYGDKSDKSDYGSVAAAAAGRALSGITSDSDKEKAIATAAKSAAERAVKILVSMSEEGNRIKEDYSFLTTFATTCAEDTGMMALPGAGNMIAAIQTLATSKSPSSGT
ncbi:MAG: hypothetical protein LBC11_00820 [Puniceicoccales bacterium]|jgi:chromosome segregation ATPase|nr:hypothetical protein [Puniceicoccales bacterium]